MAIGYGVVLFGLLPPIGLAWWGFLWLRSRRGDSPSLRMWVALGTVLSVVVTVLSGWLRP